MIKITKGKSIPTHLDGYDQAIEYTPPVQSYPPQNTLPESVQALIYDIGQLTGQPAYPPGAQPVMYPPYGGYMPDGSSLILQSPMERLIMQVTTVVGIPALTYVAIKSEGAIRVISASVAIGLFLASFSQIRLWLAGAAMSAAQAAAAGGQAVAQTVGPPSIVTPVQ